MRRIDSIAFFSASILVSTLVQCAVSQANECKDAERALAAYGDKALERSTKAINSAPKLQGNGLAYYEANCKNSEESLIEARTSYRLNSILMKACNHPKEKQDYWNKSFEQDIATSQKQRDDDCGRVETIKKSESAKKR